MLSKLCSAVLLILLSAAGSVAQTAADAALPRSPLGSRAAALLETIARGDEASVRGFFAEHVGSEFRDAYPMEQHVSMFERMHRNLGRAEVIGFEESSGTQGSLIVRGATTGDRFQIRLAVEDRPPHRITEISVGVAAGNETAGAAAVALDAAARGAVVDSVATLFAQRHLFPDTGQMIATHLRQRAASGAYDAMATPQQFAQALTADIRSVNPDRHLNVRAGSAAMPRRPGGGPDPAPGMISRKERLAGNVGYLKLDVIGGSPEAFREVEAALRQLDGTDAMILDLRGVPGGSAQMANFIISHFTQPGLHSLTVVTPATGDTTQRYTLAEVPGPRRVDVPLYVLVDGRSASAAEDIPFVLQNLGRAKLVGERTAGAGRNTRIFPVGYGMAASISWTRVIDPHSGREWERVGVAPDLATSSADALQAAHRDALQALLSKANDSARKAELRRALQEATRASAQYDDLAEILREVRQRTSIPAIAAAVVRGDSIVAAGAQGVRRLGESAEVTAADRFHVGSLVKEMTGTLIGDLIEEGGLSWTMTLGEVFPDLRAQMNPRFRNVTLEQILQHRGGIAPFTRLGPEHARLFGSFQGTDREQRRQFAAYLLAQEPAAEPGTETHYSNAGYGLVAAIAEQVTGRAWEELIQERVTRPLGMTTIAFGSPPETGDGQPWGHSAGNGAFVPMPQQFPRNRAALRPAGGMSMSIEDLARFARAHVLALSGKETILRPETARRLFTGKAGLLAGGNGYYTSMISLHPEQGVAIVVSTNSGAEEVLKQTIQTLRQRYAPETCGSSGCTERGS